MIKNQRLFFISMGALIIYVVILFLAPTTTNYPLPDYTKQDIYNILHSADKKLNVPDNIDQKIDIIDTKANSSVGRYIQEHKLSENKLNELKNEVPLYTINVEVATQYFQINPNNDQVISANELNIPIKSENDVVKFIHTYFSDEYIQENNKKHPSSASYIFTAPTTFSTISKVVEVYVMDNTIVEFNHYGLATGYPYEQEESYALLVLLIFILLLLITLVIIVTIQLIKRLINKQIEAFLWPFILALAAGIGWFFLTSAMGVSISGFGMIEPALFSYLTFATLLIRWKKQTITHKERIHNWQTSIWNGFLLTIIALALGELYFLIATNLGGWASPVLNHGMLINMNIGLLPIFALCIGLSAAITEEAIFRNYMVPFFDRFGVIVSVFATSFLWGILHIGYDMYPWYLYVIDFIIITGPLFYFVYKKLGFKTVIFLHFFYNSWVTSLFAFSVNLSIALLSVLVTLSPLALLLIRREKQQSRNPIA